MDILGILVVGMPLAATVPPGMPLAAIELGTMPFCDMTLVGTLPGTLEVVGTLVGAESWWWAGEAGGTGPLVEVVGTDRSTLSLIHSGLVTELTPLLTILLLALTGPLLTLPLPGPVLVLPVKFPSLTLQILSGMGESCGRGAMGDCWGVTVAGWGAGARCPAMLPCM